MGQGQSTAGASPAAAAPQKTCYYETLGVSQQATDDEIKKAYRRKALELHPDRNYGNVDAATAQFAAVQAAHEILSDPHERAWYDSHRDAILSGAVDGDGADVHANGVRVTTADDITRLYMAADPSTFSPSNPKTFAALKTLFDKLADEETLAASNDGLPVPDWPPFGTIDDTFDAGMRQFYSAWTGFLTKKTFAWKDIYRLSEAPDRRTRRAMEKENGRLRAQGIKEFNEAVRALVAFVRKRDPRYAPNSQTEEERQKMLRDMAAEQAARARKENAKAAEAWVAPDWVAEPAKDEHEGGFDESSDEEEIVLECVVCNKAFKSESQFAAHEASKKHRKAVAELERRMRKENRDLGLDIKQVDEEEVTEETDEEELESESIAAQEEDETAATAPSADDTEDENEPSTNTAPAAIESGTESSDVDSDYAPREAVEARLVGDKAPTDASDITNDLASSNLDSPGSATPVSITTSSRGGPKVGAAKLKRQKKEAAAAAAEVKTSPTEAFRCAMCQSGFPSKTRLFSHINEMGHARPVPAGGGGGGGKKAKKGKK